MRKGQGSRGKKNQMLMRTEGFKQLIVWQKAYAFALGIYKTTQTFPKNELYGLVSQMRRSAISVSANIAEGYERQHRKEYLQFLTIARGSLGELESYLLFSKDLKFTSSTFKMAMSSRESRTISFTFSLEYFLFSITTESAPLIR